VAPGRDAVDEEPMLEVVLADGADLPAPLSGRN
jgi:hypothetical protein